MGKTIKTREVVKDIKIHDSAVNVGGRIKDVGVKTKDSVMENINDTNADSPQQYAADKVTNATRNATESAVAGGEKVTKKAVTKTSNKVRQKIKDKKATKETEQEKSDIEQETPNDETASQSKDNKKSGKKKEPEQKSDIKEKSQATPKTKDKIPADDKRKPRQRKQTPPKQKEKGTVKKVNENKGILKPNSANGKIKQTKKSAEGTNKTIKTAKSSVKTADRTVKTTKSTTKATAETAKRTKQAAQATAKATVKTVKVVGKALVEAGKAVVAGVKSIGAVIAAGGVPAIVVVIVICLIGAIGGTCFGIFLSNDESTGTDKTMSQAITELTSEHYANLTAMKTSYTYDFFEVQGNASINWKDVLAVYAVKTTTSSDEPLEVVTIDDKKLDLLREIVNDMNTMTGVVTPKVVAETTVTTDADGNPVKTTTYVAKQVLTVVIVQLNANQIAEVYKFNDEQKAQLAELMSEDYNVLWAELVEANGDIVVGEGSWQGTNMFTWPLTVDGTITSRFGTRTDPISGEIKTHGGTDIVAAEGTSILAAADGTVVSANWHNSYGYYVKIKHNDTYSTLYAHSSALLVSAGQTVKQGQTIDIVGSTGYSTGSHLHYEIMQNGVRVDALRFYKQ